MSVIGIAVPLRAADRVTGNVRDPQGRPVAGATVRIESGSESKTNEDGSYSLELNGAFVHKLTAELEGFVPVQLQITGAGDLKIDLQFTKLAPSTQTMDIVADVNGGDVLNPDPGQRFFIRDEMLDANPGRPGAPLSIPGLPVETASGGIKAPQYFSPGVAGDHGEPIAQFFQVGGYLVPNNLSANAHGNGYADPNMIVPAVIESVQTDGGAFNVREGNHAVDLGVTYGFRSRLEPFVMVTTDAHDIDVAAGWSPGGPATKSFVAIETAYGNGFLERREHRRQYKINGLRAFDFRKHQLTLFAIGYYGNSAIPGLVPIGVSSLDDTIDQRQGDQTHTGEFAANDVWHLNPGTEFQFSGFFRTYNLALFSNFGDGLIRQSEFRTEAGGQTTYIKKFGESLSILAGMNYSRESPRRLDLDRYASSDPFVYGPFQRITANDVTLNFLSPYVSLNGRLASWLRFNIGWRSDEIGFDNTDLLTPSHSFNRWTNVSSPKATLNIVAPESLPLPSVSFSMGETFFTNDPRIGVGSISGDLVSRAHAYQMVAMKTVMGTDLRVELGHVTQEQSLAKIDPDTGLQFTQGPSRNQYVTASVRRRFRIGMAQASFSKADARDLASGLPVPEAPRLIFDALGTIDRLPFHLKARAEFEEVGRKPLGDGFVGVPLRELRGSLVRPFWNGRLDAGLNFQIVRGYTGQTTEVLALPGEGDPSERIVGVRIPSYAGVSMTSHF
jgi:hypothetical protein